MSEVVRGGRAALRARLTTGLVAVCLALATAPPADAVTVGRSAEVDRSSVVRSMAAAAELKADPVSGQTHDATGQPGKPITVRLLGSGSDGADLTYSAAQPSSGTTEIVGDQLTYTPNAGFSGSDQFGYTVSDGADGSATSTVTITVLANKAPTASDATETTRGSTTRQGDPAAIPLTATDPDSDPLTYTVQDPTHGTATISTAGSSGRPTVTYVPDAGWAGPDVFTYSAADGYGGVGTGTVTVTVTANRIPVGTPLQQTVRPGSTNTFTLSATDPDNDVPLTYSLTTTPTLGTASLTPGGVLTYAANATAAGKDPIGITVTDARGAAGTFTATLTVNTAPVASDVSTTVKGATTRTGDIARVDLAATDPDVPDRTLRYELLDQPAPSEGTVGLSGSQLTFTPKAGYSGTVGLRYRATDTAGEFATATVTIVVSPNEAPTTPNVAKQTQGSTGKPGDPVTIALPGSDVDGVASYSFSTPARGTAVRAPECAAAPALCSSVVYTPSATNAGGTDTFTYTATDTRGATSSGTVTVDVLKNTAPRPVSVSVNTRAGDRISIQLSAADDQGDGLTFNGLGTPAQGTGAVSYNSRSGVVTFTPQTGFSGVTSFTYRVTDDRGAVSAAATVTVSVLANRAPLAPPISGDTRGSSARVTGEPVDIAFTATDPEGDSLTYSGLSALNGTVVPTSVPTGAGMVPGLRYTPAAGFHGTDLIRYTVTDSRLAATQAEVSVTVEENHAPSADPVMAVTGASTVGAGLPVVVQLASVDPDGDAVSFGVGTVSATAGVISGISGAQFTFTPVQGFDGPVLVPYTVTDALGATATGIVLIDVKENRAPVAASASAVTRGGTTVAGLPVRILLAGKVSDPDPFGDRLTVTASAASGTVTVSGTTLTYTPRARIVGPNVITYQVSDGRGGSASSTVTVNVTANRAPSIAAQARRIPAGGSVVVNLTGTDPDGDARTYSASTPARGTVSVVPSTGRLLYTAPQGFAGVVVVPVTVRDAYGATAASRVTYTMYGPSRIVEVRAPASPLSTVAPKFGVTVSAGIGSVSGGMVTVKADGVVLGSAPVAWNGTVTITSRSKLTKGRHAIAVSFAGTATTSSAPIANTSLTVR